MTLEARARKAREELFTRYDQLNALWLAAEERLTNQHIPHEVCHPYHQYNIDEQDPMAGYACNCLGLVKVKGKWRICYGTYDYSYPFPRDWTPIVDCSAEIRAD